MIVLRTLVCAACCVIVLSVRAPPRVLQVRAQDNQQYQVAGYPSYNDAADERARHFGASKVQALARLDNEFMNAVRLDVTTYAPRPTTSMPQSRLRSLCLTPRGKFPHPLDCRKYVDCWDGRVLEKRCPNDLVFSDLPGEFCDYLEYVDCGNRPVLLDSNEQVVAVANLPINAPQPAATTRAPPPPPPAAFAKWVAASNGALPDSAVPSGGVIIGPGTTDQSMYVGRALVDGNVLPCTLVPRAPVQGCYVAWNNAENLYKQYEVLQSNGAKWISMSSNSTIPSNAIPTGLLDVSPIQRMYTGRAVIGDSLVPGYISDSNKVLIQTRQGSTFYATNYELLVLNK